MQIEKSIICKRVMLSYINNMVKERFYMKIAVVGCTGKLGSSIMKNIQKNQGFTDNYIKVEVCDPRARDNALVRVRLGGFNEDGSALVGEILHSSC